MWDLRLGAAGDRAAAGEVAGYIQTGASVCGRCTGVVHDHDSICNIVLLFKHSGRFCAHGVAERAHFGVTVEVEVSSCHLDTRARRSGCTYRVAHNLIEKHRRW